MTDRKRFDPLDMLLRRPTPGKPPSMARPAAIEPEPDYTDEELEEQMNETLARKYSPGVFWGAVGAG
jgi:hypothetical protein